MVLHLLRRVVFRSLIIIVVVEESWGDMACVMVVTSLFSDEIQRLPEHLLEHMVFELKPVAMRTASEAVVGATCSADS